MTNDEIMWTPFTWHCVNCGTTVSGFVDDEGRIKVRCLNCTTVMVRVIKKRKCPKSETITVFPPKGQVRIGIG